MEYQQNFTCPICLELAKEAVESSCCTKIYCLNCLDGAIKKFGACPCCRNKDATYHPSKIARKVISEIKVPCDHCQANVESGEMQSHLNKCPKVKVVCRLCKADLLQADVPKHTALEHQKEAKEHLVRSVLEMKNSRVGKVEPGSEVPSNHSYFKPETNRFERRAKLGTTSKYFCGGKLEGKCSCCNGHCGPDNGENCDACMELDVKRWKLGKTYLVNPAGYVCQVIRAQGTPKVACFRLLSVHKQGLFSRSQTRLKETNCRPGAPCDSCLQVENSIRLGRYANMY